MFRFFTRLYRRLAIQKPGGYRAHVRSRVTVESHHRVPLDVLCAVRSVDDMLDVFVLPDGRVWTLHLEPGRERIRRGRQALYTARLNHDGDDDPMFAERLMAEGFCRWSEDDYVHGHSAGFMFARAQRLHYATTQELEAELRSRRAEADGTNDAIRIVATLSDRIRSNARGDQARVGRNAKQFGYGYARR